VRKRSPLTAQGWANARTWAAKAQASAVKVRRRSTYEQRLGFWLFHAVPKIPPPELEHPFAKAARGRNWRLDFAWPDYRVGVEVDGGARLVRWQTNPRTGKPQPVAVGRHGQASDYEKMNVAAELGWRILRFNPEMLRHPEVAVATIGRTLTAAGWAGNTIAPAPQAPEPSPR